MEQWADNLTDDAVVCRKRIRITSGTGSIEFGMNTHG
jgi:hypothetical protein